MRLLYSLVGDLAFAKRIPMDFVFIEWRGMRGVPKITSSQIIVVDYNGTILYLILLVQ
jgi:hypothetical protein